MYLFLSSVKWCVVFFFYREVLFPLLKMIGFCRPSIYKVRIFYPVEWTSITWGQKTANISNFSTLPSSDQNRFLIATIYGRSRFTYLPNIRPITVAVGQCPRCEICPAFLVDLVKKVNKSVVINEIKTRNQ